MVENNLKIFFEGSSITKETIYNNFNYIETSLDECDIIISAKFEPGLYNSNEIQKKINTYKNINKLVLIFLVSDNSQTFKIPTNVILFRTSLYKSKNINNEYILPYLWECFEKRENPLYKSEKPKVGFCGNVNKNLGKRLSTIQILKKNKNIETDFILRKGFWAGKPNDEQLKKDYYNNLINSHFTICNRGRGNFAIRFYQALSIGRIPILIDSDMLFPFEDKIDWDDIIIKAKSEKDLALKILNWWHNKNENDVVKAQLKCRAIFDEYFTPSSFSKLVEEILIQKVFEFKNKKLPKDNFFKRFFNKLFN